MADISLQQYSLENQQNIECMLCGGEHGNNTFCQADPSDFMPTMDGGL